MKHVQFVMILCSLAMICSCGSSTKVTSSWKNQEAPASASKMQKVMVVALLPQRDRSIQQTMEKGLVEKLRQKGIQAFSAYDQYGPAGLPRDEKKAVKQLRKSGVDGVLTIVLLDKTKEQDYVPGNVMLRPYGPYYNHFWGYYNNMWGRVYEPGYYETNTTYFFESNLYNLNADKLLYSVQTETFDPSSVDRLSKEYSQSIVEDMMKGGVLVALR